MEEDEDLEKIRSRKLKNFAQRKEGKSAHALVDTPIEVTDSDFNEVIKKNDLVVIDCWAAWCAPCRMMGPIMEELAKNYAGKVLFGKLNVDENRMVPIEYQIMSIPTILVFKDGKLVDQIIGAMPRKLLEQRMTRHL